MDTVAAIFTQLGADSTIIHQFVVVIALFILTKLVFLNKLQNILETREEKTVKLEDSAGDMFEKVAALENEYKEKLNSAHEEAHLEFSNEKTGFIKDQNSRVKIIEDKVQVDVDSARTSNEKEISSKKEGLISEAGTLADSLINKMTH